MEDLRKGQIAVYVPDEWSIWLFTGVIKELNDKEVVLEKPNTGETRTFPIGQIKDADKHFEELMTDILDRTGEDL